MRTAARWPVLVRTGATICDILVGLVAKVVGKAGLAGCTAIRLAGALNPVIVGFVAIGPVALTKGSGSKGREKEDK